MPIPLIGSAVAAIGSYLASKGLNLLSSVFKGGLDKGAAKIAETIKAKTGIDIENAAEGKLTDEQVIKLKEFELQHEEMLLEHTQEMGALELEAEKARLADVADARDMQKAALAQGDVFSKRFIYFYAAIITALTFLYIFLVTFLDIPEDNMRLVDTVLGFLLGVTLSAIIQFFFGSSKGSSDKQEQMNKLTAQITSLYKGKN